MLLLPSLAHILKAQDQGDQALGKRECLDQRCAHIKITFLPFMVSHLMSCFCITLYDVRGGLGKQSVGNLGGSPNEPKSSVQLFTLIIIMDGCVGYDFDHCDQ